MTDCYLGIDAGGTSTRAVLVDRSGMCRGIGRSGPGNPISAGPDLAASHIVAAAIAALDVAALPRRSALGGVVAMAGSTVSQHAGFLEEPFTRAGLPEVTVAPDLLATFLSATPAADGYGVVAGTGAVALRVRGFALDAISDGLGWLLGDEGSGFWIGREVARAALAHLDGRGGSTLLSDLIVEDLSLAPARVTAEHGRLGIVQGILDELYAGRPVELARLAPLAFRAADAEDEVATSIIRGAGEALATSLRSLISAEVSGPLVLGGSVLTHQPSIADRITQELPGPPPLLTSDGLVGAANLALRRQGIEVSPATFETLSRTIAEDGPSQLSAQPAPREE